ncbi:MAG: hypothetical protein HKM94_07530 [Halobacteria archaeon]|nr:hypothetical protein [Halobacteria archaeon]
MNKLKHLTEIQQRNDLREMYLVPTDNMPPEKEANAFDPDESMLSLDDVLFQETEDGGPKIRYGYRTGSMRFLVPEGTVSELLHSTKIYHLPNAPRWVVGLINMHGNVIPVVDVASYVGDEISHLQKSNVLAIGRSETAIGILIDGLPEAIKENEIETGLSAMPEKLDGYVKAGLYSDGYNWHEFEVYKLFQKLASNNADIDNQ